MLANVPAWCRLRSGTGSVLVVVPHGGLCERDLLEPHGGTTLRGNDLYTDEVASALATRLDASLIANTAVDRNDLDLNRIDEVVARAPWFLRALEGEIARILARHAVAQVLFVHGWHVVQPQCDLGIGARLGSASDAVAQQKCLTVVPGYVAGSLGLLDRLAARAGVRTSLGERWPAAHRNNVMQLFRRSGAPDAGPGGAGLRALVATGRVRAVQLELAAPLRWPGPWREGFLSAAASAFGAPRETGEPFAVPRSPEPIDPPLRQDGLERFALQAHDGAAGLGIVVGIGALSRSELGARLLLLPGGQRLLLFTGHARRPGGPPLAVGGLDVAARDGAIEVRFAGPVLDVPDASRYFAHEPAQLAARVTRLELTLRFDATADGWGRVSGSAATADRTWSIAAQGFSEPVLGRPAAFRSGQATRLTASFGGELGLTVELTPAGASLARVTRAGRRVEALGEAGVGLRAEPGALPEPFAVPLPDESALVCAPRSHVTILRPVGTGVLARVTFGTAMYRLGHGRLGSGFYEHATALAAGVEQASEGA